MVIFMIACGGETENEGAFEEVDNPVEDETEANEEIDDSTEGDETNLPLEEEVEEKTKEPEIEEVEEEIEPLYQLHGATVRPIEEGTPENVVLITIDDSFDSPSESKTYYALEMAQILKDLDAGAIFFVNGQGLAHEHNREMLREIYELGFEIGNHSMTHSNFRNLSEEEARAEIIELNDLIEEITGERPRFFRAPFGINTDVTREVTAEEGMQWMNWTYGYDWEEGYMEAEPLAEIMVETELLRNGANLLMHDRDFTRDALKDIVEGLRDKGFEIVDPALIK